MSLPCPKCSSVNTYEGPFSFHCRKCGNIFGESKRKGEIHLTDLEPDAETSKLNAWREEPSRPKIDADSKTALRIDYEMEELYETRTYTPIDDSQTFKILAKRDKSTGKITSMVKLEFAENITVAKKEFSTEQDYLNDVASMEQFMKGRYDPTPNIMTKRDLEDAGKLTTFEQNKKKKKPCDRFLSGCPYNKDHECVYEEDECFIPNDE